MMDIDELLVIEQFLQIHRTQGAAAAIMWAAKEEAKLEAARPPHLKLVPKSQKS
jgi:hypothetical protein